MSKNKSAFGELRYDYKGIVQSWTGLQFKAGL